MPDPLSFDLQAHSVHSDGSLDAAEVVERAAAAGVELFALTDHDTVDGVPEAAARARQLGLRYSPAAELSAVHGGHEDLHVLGYELDVSDPDLIATLEDFRGDRARRIEQMADRLRELGFELDDAPLVARRDAGKPIGRPHLAVAVWAHPFWDVDNEPEALATLNTFVAAGLDGVECFYATHTQEQTEALYRAANGLLTTG